MARRNIYLTDDLDKRVRAAIDAGQLDASDVCPGALGRALNGQKDGSEHQADADQLGRRGVLVTARKNGDPPWGFVTGGVEPGELPEDAAVREVKEETGLDVRFSEVIGERDHPQTGRRMIYMAARPVRGLKVLVGDEAELSEVRWVSVAEALDLMPGMFGPVRDYLHRGGTS